MRPHLTGAKAVAGITFASLGYYTLVIYQEVVVEIYKSPMLSVWSAVIGFVVGWRVMGDWVHCSLRTAAQRGLLTTIWYFIWALILFSVAEMIRRSMEHRGAKPIEAIGKVFEISKELALNALDLKVILTLVLGGMVAGVLTELAARKWR